MSTRHAKHELSQDEEPPTAAGEEVLHEAEEAETSVADDGGRAARMARGMAQGYAWLPDRRRRSGSKPVHCRLMGKNAS
ncbi:hypothetical protein [Streptomyces sp. NPDC005752]|uniref:hypothetical protein n=1 Tax=Streptomyces sp. NPDC005752 TaxID=3157065 RepID=UPI0033F6646A